MNREINAPEYIPDNSVQGKLLHHPAECWSLSGVEGRGSVSIQAQADLEDWKQIHLRLPQSMAKARFLGRAPRALTTEDGAAQSV